MNEKSPATLSLPDTSLASTFAFDDMVTVKEVNGWEFQVLARNSPVYGDWSSSGALHLQIKHTELGTRILTPSSLTDWEIELHHDIRLRTPCWGCMWTHLEKRGIQPPDFFWVEWALHAWVHTCLIGVRA